MSCSCADLMITNRVRQIPLLPQHSEEKKKLKTELEGVHARHEEDAIRHAKLELHLDRAKEAYARDLSRTHATGETEQESAVALAIRQHKLEKSELKQQLATLQASHDDHSQARVQKEAELKRLINQHAEEKHGLKKELLDLQSRHDEHHRERLRVSEELDSANRRNVDDQALLRRELQEQNSGAMEKIKLQTSEEKRKYREELVVAQTAAEEHGEARKNLNTHVYGLIK